MEAINQKVIMEYAIKGLNNDIEKLDKKIREGEKYIVARLNGEKIDKSPLSIEELRNKVKELKVEIATLEEMKNEIKWNIQDYS